MLNLLQDHGRSVRGADRKALRRLSRRAAAYQPRQWAGVEALESRVLLSADPAIGELFVSANTLDLSSPVVEKPGQISSFDEIEMIAIDVEAGQVFSFDIDGDGAFNSYIRIFDANGKQIAANDNGKAYGESKSADSFKTVTFKKAGRYYIAISSAGNHKYNPVTGAKIKPGKTIGEYTLQITALTPTDTAGNKLKDAASLGVVSSQLSIDEFIGSKDTNDYFSFTLETAGKLTATLSGLTTGDATLELIHDANGNFKVTKKELLAVSKTKGVADESVEETLSAGTYYVRVARVGGDSYYNLNLSFTPVEPTPDPDPQPDPEPVLIPELTVLGNNKSIAKGDNSPSSTDHTNFGSTEQGSSDLVRTFTVRNDGTGVLTLSGLSVTGGFTIVEGLSSSLAAGASDTFTIKLSSANVGTFNGVVSFTSNDSDEAAFSFAITGTVTAPPPVLVPELTVLGNNKSIAKGDNSPSSTDHTNFGSTEQGSSDLVRTFTVRNDGTGVLTLSGLSVTGGFTIVEGLSSSLAAGASDTFTIKLSSAVVGSFSGLVSFTSNDADETIFSFAISGTVTQPPAPQPADWFDTNLNDAGIIALARSLFSDGSLSRGDVIQILTEAGADDGVVNATELSDLRKIVSSASTLNMADHVTYLASQVVNTNVANAKYAGAALGNLYAGATADHLNKLIGKWFLGSDHPLATPYGGGTPYTYTMATGQLFINGASYSDVKQGNVGDCYFLASLGAIAMVDPSAITDMFIDNGDGTFTVRFFQNGAERYVTVDRYLPTNSSGKLVFAGSGASATSSTTELWVALAEKAYAQLNEQGWIGQDGVNSYQGINGGWMETVNEQVLGYNSNSYYMPSMSSVINLFNAGHAITLGSNASTGNGVVANHAYVLTGYDAATQTFTLYNPWGYNHLTNVSWSVIASNFAWISTTVV